MWRRYGWPPQGGCLVTFHSWEENEFVLGLVRDEKFWFKWDHTHNHVMSGPFIGAFQPKGSREPDGVAVGFRRALDIPQLGSGWSEGRPRTLTAPWLRGGVAV